MKISYSSSFRKTFRKKVKGRAEIENKFWKCTQIFIKDPFDKRLRTHKLRANLKGLWSFTVEYDLRVVFYFSPDRNAIFIDIGNHDEVY